MNKSVLIVDDEENILELLARLLSNKGYDVDTAASGNEAARLFREKSYEVVLTDLVMPGMDGRELIPVLKDISPTVDIIVMSAFGTIDTAVECISMGAASYIFKPLNMEQVFHNVQILFALKKYGEAEKRRREEALRKGSFLGLLGDSFSMQKVYETIKIVGPTDVPVLIIGESGTGKELVARALHVSSRRKDEKFIVINCGALSESLLLSELFGHMKGSFTGAIADKKGLIQVADAGTIFLDEISEASPRVQVSLLRVLEEKTFRPIGETRDSSADIRIIAATSENLLKRIDQGLFREDLFYRLNVIPIFLPPLRERREDIRTLAYYFLQIYAQKQSKGITGISPLAMSLLIDFDWPGNVRELENTIERAVTFCHDKVIQPRHFQEKLKEKKAGVALTVEEIMPLDETKKRAESAMIRKALERTGWRKNHTARLLNINPATLWKKMKAYGITKPSDKVRKKGG